MDNDFQKNKQCKAMYVSVAVCWILTAAFVVEHITGQRSRDEIAVYSTVNPNEASLESLVRLPSIGPVTAEAILEYRLGTPEGKEAFIKPSDLQGVKGIGPKTVKKIEPWLSFNNGTP